ncbi:S-layer homology domain-containing protein [Paenibacillus sp. GCM10027626]|uniref:S-layer homology domain-containing protein n=1 Tax=Paenibacillus sp. GCM10027626 TaxID=3273411 RepID=UPI00363731A7
MKKLLINKTAAVLVFAMMLSILTPIIAFAASFQNVKQDGNRVTADVYLTDSEYQQLGTDKTKITVGVYGKDGVITSVYATYNTYKNAFVLDYTITENTYFMYGSVATDTYQYSGGGGYPGFPGGPFLPGGNGIVNSDGTVNKAALIAALKANEHAVVMTPSDVVYLPADALIEGKILTLKMEDGTSYTLPIAALKLEELAKSLGVELKDLIIRVEMKKVTGENATKLEEAAKKAGVKELANAVDFKVFAVANGKEKELKNFDQYITRTLPLKEELADAKKATGVMFDPVTGKLSYVPATFATENGKSIATLLRKGNSIYTVVSAEAISFKDIPANHWGKAEIEALAAKLIVQGTGKDLFTPNRNITRAEFATMIARALGLDTSATTSSFKDVASNKWFTGAVAAAAEAGIVKGTGAGKFSPDANITRKEIAAMVVRALAYTGKNVTLTDAEATQALAAYTDAANLGWAKGEVAAAIKAGIVKGQSSTKVVADAKATRAEAATMIYRTLDQAGFIN